MIRLCTAKMLHALNAFVDPKDIRANLKGVWVENTNKGLILIATNGAALAAIKVGEYQAESGAFNLLIPHSVIKDLPKSNEDVTLNGPHITVANNTVHWKDENFALLDWRRVIPKNPTNEPSLINSALLQKFAGLAVAAGATKDVASLWVRVTYNGTSSALVDIPKIPYLVGVVMPYVIKDAPAPLVPNWAC